MYWVFLAFQNKTHKNIMPRDCVNDKYKRQRFVVRKLWFKNKTPCNDRIKAKQNISTLSQIVLKPTLHNQWSSWCSVWWTCPRAGQCDHLRRKLSAAHPEKTCRKEKTENAPFTKWVQPSDRSWFDLTGPSSIYGVASFKTFNRRTIKGQMSKKKDSHQDL